MKVLLEPPLPSTSRRRTSLAFLAAIGVAAIALLTIVNYYGLATTTSSQTFASTARYSDRASAMVALEQQQRNSEMLEEILSMLRTKRFIDVANGTDDAADATDVLNLRATEKLLERAEELLAEKLLRDERDEDTVGEEQPKTDDVQASTETELFPAEHDGSNIHLVFSMSCGHRNRLVLQTILQLTAAWVGQKGPITQILSGCSDEEREKVMLEPTFYYDFRRHFTPNFASKLEPGYEDNYAAYNKPFGLRHFLLNANPPIKHEVLALIDGDFVFFRPLEANTGRDVSKYYHGSRDPRSVNDTVAEGLALAQDWTNILKGGLYAEERAAELSSACAGQACGLIEREEAAEMFANSGPPYLMTVSDVKRMVDDYCHLCVTSRQVSKDWMTELYAYSLAAANNGIQHALLNNLGVTTIGYGGEGHEHWDFVNDSLPNPCEDDLEVVMPDSAPVSLHYCQFIANFYKGQLPDNVTACDSPILKLFPSSMWTEAMEAQDEGSRRYLRHTLGAVHAAEDCEPRTNPDKGGDVSERVQQLPRHGPHPRLAARRVDY